jgi:hypothetical protein
LYERPESRELDLELSFGEAYYRVIMRPVFSGFAVCVISISWVPCVAQETAPVIYPSTAESAKAKQAAEDLRGAQDRDKKAMAGWEDFYRAYQRAHPELPGLRFTSDFRVAFARRNSTNPAYPLSLEAAVVELSAQEQQNAVSLHREMEEARAALLQAQKKWTDNWHQLVLDHVGASPDGSGSSVQLPDGKSAVIPNPWANGVIFTPDFRVGVPQFP